MRKLLRLAALSPKALAALAADRIDVAYAQALTLTDDRSVQDAVLKRAASAPEARRLLTCHKVTTTHRLFRFVAGEYAAAGGSVTHDLFGSDGYADDAEWVAKLVGDKLDALADAARSDGWGEVVAAENEPPQVYGWHRISPEGTREWTDEESEAVANAQARLAAREESLGEAEPSAEDRAYLAEQRSIIAHARQAARSFTPEQKAGGCLVITVDHDGTTRRTAYAKRLPRVSTAANGNTEDRPLYAATLVEGLSKMRTQALQLTLARTPAVAIAVLLDALLPLADGSGHGHAVVLRADAARLDGTEGLNALPLPAPAAEVADLLAELPSEPQARFDWMRGLSAEASARLLAYATASLVDATQGKFADPRRLTCAERIVEAAGLDMREHWSGGAEFFARLTKRACLEALREGVGRQAADNCAKLGKADLAKACAERLAGSDWLPQPLRAPVAVAAAATDEGGDEKLAA